MRGCQSLVTFNGWNLSKYWFYLLNSTRHFRNRMLWRFVWSDFLLTPAQWYPSKSDCSGETSQAVWSNSFFHVLIHLPIAKLMPCSPLSIPAVTQRTNYSIRLTIWVSLCELQGSFLLLFSHLEYARSSVFGPPEWVAFLFLALFFYYFQKHCYGRQLVMDHEISEENYHVG